MKTTLLSGTFLLLSVMPLFVKAEQCNDVDKKVQVSAVYPTADTLPENLLRFYIYFDHPIRAEKPLSHIYLTNQRGERLDGVFLENKFNLWSPDRTRLTLLFDPGRVKTGLVANHTLGRALQQGSSYNLVIDIGSISRLACTSIYTKTFYVEEAHYSKPTISEWLVNHPKLGTEQPLTIDFQAPMDHTSLAYRIRIKDNDNNIVSGFIDLGSQEKQWIFTPDQSWSANKTYSLFIDPILEDIVGNRLTGLFDQPSLSEESMNLNNKVEVAIKFTN
ncbi:Ig-like domain-containing protein [Vibrio tubiashii]|uniref:Ig-like domain-containing protein n=1 Tax=Vibrio tubiashii TaxID=29498 RepID=UPI001EFCA548|nr:Ig-like domain-containing protein [Vibrio tubiashii]MCG9580743.1 Ig-like domain-containing protein [Vibrio tubiashii]MCG9614334.1 Ig-like domain-containing protein [Vibrio tubiashii]MCG9689623.1 Ig-like domain-containing protein [Vibrio tubiashii]